MSSDPFFGHYAFPSTCAGWLFSDGIGTLPLAASATEPERTVDITIERKLTNFDLGINGGEISPDGTQVLIFGEDGYAHLLSAENADDETTDVRLENETTNSLKAVGWHPGGKALYW